MIEIDGTFGEGGGQILRTSLSLAAITGQAVHIVNIRAKRTKPGLMRQHLACVKAVTEITGGRVIGAELSSRELTFEPGTIHGGDYHFAVGSAGSVTLIAQTVIPALLCADVPSHVVIEGGTHTDQSPIFEFFDRVYLPALRKMGADITAKMEMRDVAYRIYADMEYLPPKQRQNDKPNPEKGPETPEKYFSMFERRASKGQTFHNPYLGTRECAAYFKFIPESELQQEITANPPLSAEYDRDFGIMLFDMDFTNVNDPQAMFFHAKMHNGCVDIPDETEVLR